MRQKRHMVVLLLTILFVWQIDSVLHLYFTPHILCKHGTISDVNPTTDIPHHHPTDENNSNHQKCQILTLLTTAATQVASPLSFEMVLEEAQFPSTRNYGEIIYPSRQKILSISPCNSPPPVV